MSLALPGALRRARSRAGRALPELDVSPARLLLVCAVVIALLVIPPFFYLVRTSVVVERQLQVVGLTLDNYGRVLDPANLPLVKQPNLNHSALAYTVGWIKYEQGDFEGALTAFGKGLALYPHDHALQSEYLATLMQLQRFDQLVAFADKVLTTTYDLTDEDRSKFYAARGVALVFKNDLAGADDSLTVALRYSWSEDVAKMQAEIRAAAAKGATGQ